MKAKLGIAPIGWTNDDLPELGGDIALETCLSDSQAAGFSGMERGGKFPNSAEEMLSVLGRYDLKLVTGWYSGTVLDTDLEAEKEQVREQLDLFKAVDCVCIVYGETAGTIQNVRDAPLNTRRRLSDDQIRDYGHRLTAFAEFCADEGMPLAFHHHMATAIETEQDLDTLMAHTGEAVGLLYDAGHMAFAGGDILRVIDNHGPRIVHVHTKDVRNSVIDGIDRDRVSFLDAVIQGAFTVPGDGSIDFDAVIQRLADQGYEGWFIVEAEQDPVKAPPAEYARIGHDALVGSLTKAGYEIER
ncbi:MAG TPA: myo-inosose-2 dehydratase [Afifellaceae bacterium]|nr:myo-inosose-2 dehydratase [Afifellaceae bacterium]